jgi:hypothetical protein
MTGNAVHIPNYRLSLDSLRCSIVIAGQNPFFPISDVIQPSFLFVSLAVRSLVSLLVFAVAGDVLLTFLFPFGPQGWISRIPLPPFFVYCRPFFGMVPIIVPSAFSNLLVMSQSVAATFFPLSEAALFRREIFSGSSELFLLFNLHSFLSINAEIKFSEFRFQFPIRPVISIPSQFMD